MPTLHARMVGHALRAGRAFGDRAVNDLVERAKALACRAHAGQVDKAGRPYIEHVTRVAAAVSDDPEAEVVAWLHDVREDCDDSFRLEILEKFPSSVYVDCYFLDRKSARCEAEYYACIRAGKVTRRVKLADIADNADDSRLALLDPKTADRLRRKYKKAMEALT